MNKSYTALKKLSAKDNEIEFEAEIPLEVLEDYIAEALTEHAENFSMPGFRKGKVPEHLVRENVNEMALLETAADSALYEALREIILDQKISLLGSPQITITKIALKNPVSFKVHLAVQPEISLPDYKKIGHTIATKEEVVEVGDEEVKTAIQRIQDIFKKANKENPDAPLPELTDEFVKQLGPFQNVEEFRTEIKNQILAEKKIRLKETKRNEIIKKILEESKLKIPQLFLDQEFQIFKEDQALKLKEANLTLDSYLKESGKTLETLEKEEKAMIEEQIKTSLVLREIREKEKITAEEKDIETNSALLKHRYPDRSDDDIRRTAETIIIQEKLFDLLEGLPKIEAETETKEK